MMEVEDLHSFAEELEALRGSLTFRTSTIECVYINIFLEWGKGRESGNAM